MASKSIIFGSINGITKKSYARIKSEVLQCFETVVWKDNTLTIKSEKQHTNLKATVHKIAATIEGHQFGALIYVGNETVACIYLGPKQVSTRKFIEPSPPLWWGGASSKSRSKVAPAPMAV